MRFRVWCLSWEEDETAGIDVANYDPLVESKRTNHTTIWCMTHNLDNAREAAEEYATYIHSQRDGYESSWPLKFRVRLPDGTTEDYEVERETVPHFSARKIDPISDDD